MANPAQPIVKIAAVDAAGVTLDWSADPGDGSPFGMMGRLILRNRGTKSCWVSFDINGPAVVADNTTAPLTQRIEVLPNESWNFDSISFYKVGLKCGGADTTIVHAVAFQSAAGLAGAV